MTRNDGFYEGRIIGTEVEEDTFTKGGMVAVFIVEITDAAGTTEHECRHPDGSGDKEARSRCEQVFEALGLDFPKGFLDLSTVVNKDVRIRLKTTKGPQRAYIATGRKGKTLTVEEINAKLAGEDEIPF